MTETKEPLIVVSELSDIPKDGIRIELNEEFIFHIEGGNLQTNSFCVATQKELLSISSRDPLLLRHFIENQKHSVLQEHLQLKKLIEHSKMNNYSLYKAYRMLKTSQNSAVILKLLLSQNEAANNSNTSEAIDVISHILKASP